MLQETSKKGVYRGFDSKGKMNVNGIQFEWGINHHGNGNTNTEAWATFPTVGRMLHYLNICLSQTPGFEVPDFRIDQHVKIFRNADPVRIYFTNKKGHDLFLKLVKNECEARRQEKKDKEEDQARQEALYGKD